MSEKKKILIVEDDIPLRKALVDRLEQEENIELKEAIDGVEAIDIAKDFLPDLMLLDIAMPKKDGIEVYREIKDSEWGKNIHVVFLTNSSDLDHVAEVESVEPADYLVKADWDLEDIVSKIKEIL